MNAGPGPTPDDAAFLGRFSSGIAVLGQAQFLPGYSLLISAEGADRLSDLARERRLQFLADMDVLGRAVENVCGRRDPAFRRINLEIQGNLVPSLHAHVWPRYDWEPRHRAVRQVGRYPLQTWHQTGSQLGHQHRELRDELRIEIRRLLD